MDEPLSWQELLIAVFSCGLVVLYHIYLFIELKYAPHRCSLGMHFAERRRWALKCLAVRKNEILGVQSLRNSMFACTLIASSVLTVGFSLLQTIMGYRMEGRLSEHQYGIGIAVVGLMFLSFVSLSLAIRDSNCASYVVCAHPWPDETGLTPSRLNLSLLGPDICHQSLEERLQELIVIIDRFTVHWFVGFRAFLLAIPLGFWLLGQWWFLSASVVLVATLYNVDHSYAAWGL